MENYLQDIPTYVPIIALVVFVAILFFVMATPSDVIQKMGMVVLLLGIIFAILYFFSPFSKIVKERIPTKQEIKVKGDI